MNIKIPGNESKKVIEQTKKFIGEAQYAGYYGIAIKSADGCNIIDVDNNKYLDFLSGASVANLGYSRKDIIEAYCKSANNLSHSCFVYTPNPTSIELAKKIISITPGSFEKKVMFGLSGSDSVDGAIKSARAFTKKQHIVSFQNAYHGSTGLSMQATGFPGITNGFLGDNHDFSFIPFPKNETESKNILKIAEEIFIEKDCAAMLIEPILGDGGNIVPPHSFFKKLSDLSKKYDVVLIDDETQSGIGRSGKWWAIENFDVIPDLIVSAKGLTAGYLPLSLVIGKKEIIDSLHKAQHIFTFSAHPASCAVTLKVIEIIENEKVIKHVKKLGDFLRIELEKITNKHKNLNIEVRGIGLQLGMSIIEKNGEALASLFALRCLEKGLHLGYFGPKNEVLRLHPPLILSLEEASRAIKIIQSVFEEWENNTFPKATKIKHAKYCLGLGSN